VASLLKAFAAQHRPPLRRTKRNCRFLAALGTIRPRLSFRVRVPMSSSAQHGDPLALAALATFRFVFELFVVEKQLFASCKHELRPTIHALQHFILEFHWKRRSHSPCLCNHGRPERGRLRFTSWAGDLHPPQLTCGLGPPCDVHRTDYCFHALPDNLDGTILPLRGWAAPSRNGPCLFR
jgi:hypothetical protein